MRTTFRYRPALRRLSAVLAAIVFAATVAGTVAASGGDRYTGRLVSFHGDDFRTGRATARGLALVTTTGTYDLAFSGAGPQSLTGRQVEVRGTLRGHTISVGSVQAAGGTGGSGSSSTTTNTTVASTAKNVAVLLFNFQNDTSQPYSPATANGVLFTNSNSVANYFSEESYGQVSMTGDVFGWYTIAYDDTTCSYTTWASAAKSAATAAGVNLANYTNIVYAFPFASSCGWSGLAYLPGTETWNNGSMSLYTNAHELSHNFGVHHASTISCTVGGVRVALSANQSDCSLAEYGDPFSVMGSGTSRDSHTEHKAQMGWVPTADRLDVSNAGTYALGVNEQSASTPKVIRVARTGATNQYFYLEFRQPYGSYFDNFSSTDPVVQGVTIRIAPDYSALLQSWLVDTTPSTSTYGDAALAVGKTFTDPLSGISVTTQSVSSSGATVAIAFGTDAQPPSSPANLAATSASTTSIGLSWSASTDNVGVAGYRVSRNGSQVATVSGTSWTDTGLAPGTAYTYSVVAYDAAGNVSGAATVTGTTVPDSQAPTAPGGLTATPTSSNAISLSWSASTDNVGVTGYRVSRNGTVVATVAGTSWSDSGLAAGTTYSYSVVAFDAAGNVSPAATASATTSLAPVLSAPVLTVSTAKSGVTLSWSLSGSGATQVVGYRLYRNGALFATTSSTSYSLRKQKGTFSYYVVAYDAANDLSPASNTVTIKT